MNFEDLRRVVENEITEYLYAVSPGAIGNPMQPHRIAAELAALRAALVSPYWADVGSDGRV